ncbi:helix-turn-helix domain-containing protein [Bradyrhizobium sp. CCGUVB23]|uniref:helix-turn-helix domain-containing protein n=1 Tax=Bradyrhizobium sp. CCGUVB23 TaxID=2949630 RepID=UPI0020B33E69|nr:helix-turn-helix transcriptional regulator [Bradyrhizobium sp. CCGUVB23]MCP3468471.1 helix-turn-helix domain-containing protein [Bradyrhizobium sp. CCGUVB23]
MSKDSVRKRLGSQLNTARRERKWRLQDFAQRTGRNPARLSEMETGSANSSIDMLTDAGETLGMSLVYVPTERLEEVMKMIGQPTASPTAGSPMPSVYDEVFVDDSVDADEEEPSHAGPK